jgi:hypothetical protein
LDAKTRRVERITDARGAPADTQNSFGFLMLCMPRISIFDYPRILDDQVKML